MKRIYLGLCLFVLIGNQCLLAGLNDGLVAYYPFNGNANDASGFGNDAIANGVVNFEPGIINQAASFSQSWLQIPNFLNNLQSFSISLWVNEHGMTNAGPGDAESAGEAYISFGDYEMGWAGIASWGGAWAGVGDTNVAIVATVNDVNGQPVPVDLVRLKSEWRNRWHHLVMTYDSQQSSRSLFIDGVFINQKATSKVSLYGVGAIASHTWGSYGSNRSYRLLGLIDEIRIYNRTLSTSEVQALYSLPESWPLTVVQTNRTPTVAETTPAYLSSTPPSPQLMAYHGGIFTTNLASVDPNQTTFVLTHGWIPLNPLTLNLTPIFTPNGIDDWPTTMAVQLHAQNPTANIVGWNWKDTATSPLSDPQQAGSQTPGEGFQLGEALFDALGPNYSQKIHFIGHSFGTLVNAYAANYLQGTNWAGEAVSSAPWPATNMLMTLFDEAEVGADKNFIFHQADLVALINALGGQNGGYFNLPSYYHPLPRQFAWAENYVSEVGLLHTNAANVILTAGSPANAPDPVSWLLVEIGSFHEYPVSWYEPTIQTWNSAMGFVWSDLWSLNDPAFADAPTNGSVYFQADDNSPYNLTLTNWNYSVNYLIARLKSYGSGLGSSFVQFANNTLTAKGTVTGESEIAGLPSWIINESTSSGNGGSVTPQLKVHPLGLSANDESNGTNVPAYAWMQLIVPTNAVSLSFNYIIQGDWQSDSLAAAFNGTNVLLIAGNVIQTNVTFSSGSIDVSAFAGQTNEFFIGIVGGTSTNAQLTVENLAFSISLPPSLQAQASSGNLMLSWPMSAQNFSLQTTTNLADPNSWLTLTNVPAIVNLQNAVTNSASDGARFYRLKQ
jgi:hypothetical protein